MGCGPEVCGNEVGGGQQWGPQPHYLFIWLRAQKRLTTTVLYNTVLQNNCCSFMIKLDFTAS